MSPFLKTGVPAALVGAAIALGSFKLGYDAGRARGPLPPPPGAVAGNVLNVLNERDAVLSGATGAASTASKVPIGSKTLGEESDCRCRPGTFWSAEKKLCNTDPPPEPCDITSKAQPVVGCDGRSYGHPCQARSMGLKAWQAAPK